MTPRWVPRVIGLLAAVVLITGANAQVASSEVISNKWDQFSTFPVNTCNGEFVPVMSGVAHVVQRIQPDGSVATKTNGHFTEVGNLGNRYQMNWQERFVSGPNQTAFTSRQLIVTTGPEPNHIVTFTFIFPPGSFTAVEDCRG